MICTISRGYDMHNIKGNAKKKKGVLYGVLSGVLFWPRGLEA